MSAIWGIVALNEKETLPVRGRELFTKTYEEYAIDRQEVVESKRACFGCGLQYVTAEAKREVLPAEEKERKLLFTADCILDNREEVIECLAGTGNERSELEKMPDGALMFQGYLHLGKECTRLFRGLYAFAVWEEKSNTLTLVSDGVSARCLYYRRQGNLVAFSTVLKPLCELFSGTEKNTNYSKDFLLVNPSVVYVMPGETPYKDIFLMKPATIAEFSLKGTSFTEYTHKEPETGKTQTKKRKGKQEYSREFLALYRQCVKDALRCDGEVGIALSSGLDSSTIGVLAAQELEQRGKKLHSYTFVPYKKENIVLSGDQVCDESTYVKELAVKYPNIEVTVLDNHGKNVFWDREESTSTLEMPYKTGTFPNHYEMCEEGARTGCKVFLNGGFGNNTVSYGEINHILYDCYQRKKYVRLLLWLNRYCRHEKIGRRKTLRKLLENCRREQKEKIEFPTHFAPDNFFLLPTILRDYDIKSRFEADKRLLLSNHYLDRERYGEHLKATALLMYLGVFETKFGLRHGMVLRDPTKDIRMIQFCKSLPYEYFAWGGMTRWLIRYGFRELLPESFLGRWSRKGVLNADWVERVYRDWKELKPQLVQTLQEESIAEWVDAKRLAEGLERMGENKRNDSYVLTYVCALFAVAEYGKNS